MNDALGGPPIALSDPWLKARNATRGFTYRCLNWMLAFLVFGALATFVDTQLAAAIACLAYPCALAAMVSSAAWLGVIFFGFTHKRFSLRSMMISVLGIGGCGALLTGAAGGFGVFMGALMATGLLLYLFFWIWSFDP
ncbi:MAG: hypothetical protein L6R28_14125 [Planctomycetes bacterium]|nr:hypothetical protein [Planctomycetota bacterium]